MNKQKKNKKNKMAHTDLPRQPRSECEFSDSPPGVGWMVTIMVAQAKG